MCDEVPLSLAQRLEQRCNPFEAAWIAVATTGQRPCLEDFVGTTAEPERFVLVRELILIEVHHRRRLGESPLPADYQTRFPELDPAQLARWLAVQPGVRSPATPLTQPPTTQAETRSGPADAEDLPVIPGYEIVKELGRGGMGLVYWAWQTRLNRTVALKMIRAGAYAGTQEVVARFRTEAEAVARLHHPNIVQIYDVGRHDEHPYMALEYVDGGSLAQQLAGTPLPARRAAQLAETLARAVHYAHQQSIVHRDLTPANVLLTAAGVPKITDFGLAKILVGAAGVQTQSGAILGTPSYMAPEQAGGERKVIGPAADVYALGALLYEMLTGRPPFRAKTPLETLLQVRTEEPVPPSRLQPRLPRDLVTICLKCLQKEPRQRYGSAEALAEDLRRFLADQPIWARRSSAAERAWRWCRRNPTVASLIGFVALLLVLITVGSSVTALYLRAANRQGQEKLWLSLRNQARAMRMSRHPGQRVEALRSIREALPLPLPPGHSLDELRTEAITALALPDLEVLQEWEGNPAGTVGLDFDGNLERYARLAKDGTVSIRRVSDDAEIACWQEPTEGAWPGAVPNLRFSSDGRFLCVRHPTSGRLTVRRLDSPEPVVCYEGTKAEGGWGMDFSPDNKTLAYPLTGSRIAVVDLASGQPRYLSTNGAERGHMVMRFAPDGSRFAVTTRRAGKWAVEVYDAATGQVQRSLPHPEKAGPGAWHPDGRTLATCSDDSLIRLWDVASGQLLRVLEGHKSLGINCAFTRTGDRLVSNDWHHVLRVWEPSSGRQLLSFPAAGWGLLRVSPDDRVSAACHTDDTKLQLLRLHPGLEYRTIDLRGGTSSRGISADVLPEVHPGGRLLAARAGDGSVVLVDLSAGREVATLRIGRGGPLPWESSGNLLTYGTSGLLRWPVRADRAAPGCYRFGPPQRLLSASNTSQWGSSANGQTIAIPGWGGGAVVVHRGPPLRTVRLQPQQDVRWCAVSPNGRWIATGSHGTTAGFGAKVWEAATGKLVKELCVPGLCRVAFSPDGRWLLTTSGGCRLWEVSSWNEWWKVGGSTGCFSADGRLLAVADSAGAIRLVLPEDRADLARLEAPEQTGLMPSCFTPDGTRLIAVGHDTQALHVWDLRAIRAHLKELGLDWDLLPYPSTPEPVDPRSPLAVTVDPGNLGSIVLRNHPREAAALYSLALALQPLNPYAYRERARAFYQLYRDADAANDLALALSLHPRLAVPAKLCNDLAWSLVTGPEKQRDAQKVLPLARRAVELVPKKWSYHNTLGVVYYRLRQYREAVAELETSLQGDPDCSAAFDLYFLAMCYHRLDNPAKANDCYDRAVKWVQERQGKLEREEVAELNAFRAEAEALLKKDARRNPATQPGRRRLVLHAGNHPSRQTHTRRRCGRRRRN
jgi:serine/threonine protein kinase/WD40 repeat protein